MSDNHECPAEEIVFTVMDGDEAYNFYPAGSEVIDAFEIMTTMDLRETTDYRDVVLLKDKNGTFVYFQAVAVMGTSSDEIKGKG